MKKLIKWEVAMIAMTVVVVIAGHLFGWSREVTAIVAGALVFVVFVVFSATVVFAAAFVSVVDTATTATFAALAATAILAATTAAVAFVSFATVFFAFAIAIATFATLAADLPEDAKLKYHWVLGSLLAEGLAVWAILMYL